MTVRSREGDGSQDGQRTSTKSLSFSGPFALRVQNRVWCGAMFPFQARPSTQPLQEAISTMGWDLGQMHGSLFVVRAGKYKGVTLTLGLPMQPKSGKVLIGPRVLG